MYQVCFNFPLRTSPLRSHYTIIFSHLTNSFCHDNRSPVKLNLCKVNFVTDVIRCTANKYQNEWEAQNSGVKKKEAWVRNSVHCISNACYPTRCTVFQMPVTQLRISTRYFIFYCRSHSATQWNKLQRLINCANPAMRMFAAKCKQKKEVPWGSIARSTRTADSTYSTSPNVPTEWSALTARQRTSRTSDQHIQRRTERRNSDQHLQNVNERRKRMISTPAAWFLGPGFKYRHLTGCFPIFLSCSSTVTMSYQHPKTTASTV